MLAKNYSHFDHLININAIDVPIASISIIEFCMYVTCIRGITEKFEKRNRSL